MWGQSFLFVPVIWKPFVLLFEGLTFLQWFLCPTELKIIWKYQQMSFFSCLLLSGSLTLTVFTLSTPQFSPPSGVLSSSNSSVSALSGLLSPLGLYKECFLSLFYSRGCALLSLLPKTLLRGLAHQSPGWGSESPGFPWPVTPLCPEHPPEVSRASGVWLAVENGWLFLWGPWSYRALGLQSISPCREKSKSLLSNGSNEAVFSSAFLSFKGI